MRKRRARCPHRAPSYQQTNRVSSGAMETSRSNFCSSAITKPFERASEKILCVASDFLIAELPAGFSEVTIFLHQHVRNDPARVPPLIDQLVQNARVRMLRRDAQPDQLQPHPRHLLDDIRHISKPPAAEDMQVAEFARQHTKLMLIFA